MPLIIEQTTSGLSRQSFFDKYISTRTPVKFVDTKGFSDLSHIHEKWTNSYLVQCAGEEIVKVEKKESNYPRFGMGNEVWLGSASLSLHWMLKRLIYTLQHKN
jgi:hypothetical protein